MVILFNFSALSSYDLEQVLSSRKIAISLPTRMKIRIFCDFK
jgi:hypothetical protein